MQPRKQPENDDDEEGARNVERGDQLAERADRFDAVTADGERHRAERADRRQLHNEAERREQHVRERIDRFECRLAGAADARQAEPAQDRKQQHRKYLAFGECAKERVGDDVQHELGEAFGRRVVCEALRDRRIKRRRVDVHASAWLHHEYRGEPDHQRQDGEHVEQRHRLHQRLADLLAVVQARDAEHDRAEDDRRDHHLDELDEAVAERLERRAEVGPVVPDGDAEREPDEDLEVQRPIELGKLHDSSFESSGLDGKRRPGISGFRDL